MTETHPNEEDALSISAVERSSEASPPSEGNPVAGVAVSGEVDIATWEAFAAALKAAVEMARDQEDVHVDLDELSFIDAHGFELIAEVAAELGPSRRLVLENAPPIAGRIADVLRLDRHPTLVIEQRGDDGER